MKNNLKNITFNSLAYCAVWEMHHAKNHATSPIHFSLSPNSY
jgi:hypothetical protein